MNNTPYISWHNHLFIATITCMSYAHIIAFFVKYRYIAIFPVAVIEGPIISIISGLLASRGVVSFIPVYIVVFFGDFISDIFFYFLGRRGKDAVQKIKFLGVTDERLLVIEDEYKLSPWKTMVIAKVSYGLGTAFMVAAGLVGMSRKKFLTSIGALNAIRSLVLVIAGYYFGKLLLRVSGTYLEWYGLLCIILVPTIYIFVWRKRKKEKSGI